MDRPHVLDGKPPVLMVASPTSLTRMSIRGCPTARPGPGRPDRHRGHDRRPRNLHGNVPLTPPGQRNAGGQDVPSLGDKRLGDRDPDTLAPPVTTATDPFSPRSIPLRALAPSANRERRRPPRASPGRR